MTASVGPVVGRGEAPARERPAVSARPRVRLVQGGAPCSGGVRFTALVCGLAVAVVAVGVLGIAIGAVRVSPSAVWGVLAYRLRLTGEAPDAIIEQIVWTVRAPRVLLAMVVGAGLAVAGVVIQAIVRNALGDPYLIGVVPGAGLGAAAVIVTGPAALGGVSLAGAAFVGGLIAFAATFALGRHRGTWPPQRLVLAGVAVGYLCSAFTYFLQITADPHQSQRVLFWSLGSVSGADWSDLRIPAAVIAVGTVWLLLNGSRLNALVAGPELAAALGIAVARLQLALMGLAALVTGSIVAVAGGVVFVGLIIPHIARFLVGADHRRVLTTAVLLGAVFLPLADLVARTVRSPAELPLGVVTAAVGAPFFLWLMRTSGSGR